MQPAAEVGDALADGIELDHGDGLQAEKALNSSLRGPAHAGSL